MKNVAVFAFNEGCQERELRLCSFLENELGKFGWHLFDFKDKTDLKAMVEEAKFADTSLIVWDINSKENRRENFKIIAEEMCRNGIIPILLITNSDVKNADILSAEAELSDIWMMENPEWIPGDINFHNLYFSYKIMGVNIVPEVFENNSKELVEALEKTRRYK